MRRNSSKRHSGIARYFRILTSALAIVLGALAASERSSCAPPTRPNIIFFLADDLGYMDIGTNNPRTFYETPNIDSLAARGMRFTAGYAACPVCSPTRASIMTGKYPPRTGITNFIAGKLSGKLLPAPNKEYLALEEVTLAETLRGAGLRNGRLLFSCPIMEDSRLPKATPHPTFPFAEAKGGFTMGRVREPWIIRVPGVTKPGSICDTPVISNDFYPTLLELSGLPLNPKQHRDGMSLVPLLQGRSLKRGPLYWHYPHSSNQGGAPAGAVRDGDLKLIEWYEDGSLEL